MYSWEKAIALHRAESQEKDAAKQKRWTKVCQLMVVSAASVYCCANDMII